MPDLDLDQTPDRTRTTPSRTGPRPRGLFRKSLAIIALAGRANRPIAEIAEKRFPRGAQALADGAAVLRSGVGITHDPTLRPQLLVEFSNAFAPVSGFSRLRSAGNAFELGGWNELRVPSWAPSNPPLSAFIGATGTIPVIAPRIGAGRLAGLQSCRNLRVLAGTGKRQRRPNRANPRSRDFERCGRAHRHGFNRRPAGNRNSPGWPALQRARHSVD
jgi:hypothetical protein